MNKIKIVKLYETYADDYGNSVTSIAEGIEWQEVSEEELGRLKRIVSFANLNRWQLNTDYSLLIVEEVKIKSVQNVLDAATVLYEKEQETIRKKKEREDVLKASRKIDAEAKAREKKLKQLEKLKRELGQE